MATDISTNAMHGRDELLALAERRIAAVREGQGHLLLLSGEAGIGKTRLLQAMHELADGFALWGAGAFPQDIELSAGLLLDLGYAMSRSADVDVADRGPRPGERPGRDRPSRSTTPGDAHRRRRLLVLDAVERLASLADDGPGAPGARGPALVRRAQPGDRRAPGPAAALAAAAAWSARCAPTSCTRTRRSGPGGPGCCSSGSPRRPGCPAWTWRTPPGWCRSCSREPIPRRAGRARPRAVGRGAAARRGAGERRRAGAPRGRSALRARTAWPRRSSSASGCSPRTGQDCAVAAAVVRRSFDLDLLAAVAGTPVERRRRAASTS